ncbi:MAG: hypothetical protein MRQ07_04035 [Candidatus Midichloria sp.]|nr:hypothetical protein [Candidatus Midichloria sp.]
MTILVYYCDRRSNKVEHKVKVEPYVDQGTAGMTDTSQYINQLMQESIVDANVHPTADSSVVEAVVMTAPFMIR